MFNWANTTIHNLIFGDTFIWHEGEISVKHINSKACARTKLKNIRFNGTKDYSFKGEVKDENDQTTHILKGSWDSEI